MSEIICRGCFHHCRLREGQVGLCRARMNQNGENVCQNYGQLTALALDPVEKKPLALFYPGSMILSVGSYGCNLRCPFCQNHEISYASKDTVRTRTVPPGELADMAKSLENQGNIGLAFTYNEPMISWEYVRDAAKLCRENSMKNVLVTNGSSSVEILEQVLPFIDAFNIDLKGFTEEWYRELGGDFGTVKAFIKRAAADSHVELTTLVVPGKNDNVDEMEKEAEWIASINPRIPLHITRFFPRFRMTSLPPTDIARLRELKDTAGKYLKNVFLGNV